MPISAAQYQFAAEFALFLVAASGLALSLLRADLLTVRAWAKVPLAAGFASFATAAFVHGSLLADTTSPVVVGARSAGVVLVAVGATMWRGRGARLAVFAGVAVSAGGILFAVAEREGPAAGFRVVGALLLGLGLYLAGSRSIATRVAASSAASVLLIVLVTSVGLSAVLDSQVQDGAVRRLDARARQAASRLVGTTQSERLRDARFVADKLKESSADLRLAQQGLNAPGIVSAVTEPPFPAPVAFVLADGRVVAQGNTDGVAPEAMTMAFASAVFRRAITEQTGVGGVVVNGVRAQVIAAQPVLLGNSAVGAVVTVEPLDAGYLDREITDDAAISLALVGAAGVVARFGDQPASPLLVEESMRVLGTSNTAVRITDGRFVATAPVLGSEGKAVLALIASQPTEVVDNTRQQLFNTLFLIALGGTILALVLAGIVGERIGAGVRRLTAAAQALQAGELGARSDLKSADEVGVLSQAFDSMAASIEEQTTALQQAADDEARLRNRLQAIVSGMGEALVAVDAAGRITEMNEAAELLFGVFTGVAAGQRVADLAPIVAEDGPDLGHMLAHPSRERWTSRATIGNGAEAVPVALSVGPLEGAGGELGGAVLVLRDLRQEREVERMKREFLSRVGHELRTPLAPIMGFSQILFTKSVKADQARGMVESIYTSSRKLERIIEMLEFFASLEAGRPVLSPEPADLRAIIARAIESRSASLNGSHKITSRLARQLPAVAADSAWLERAIGELVDNAVKFSPKGGPIAVRAEPMSTAGRDWVAVTVTDRGIGMTAEQIEKAFTEWSQGDESDTRHFGGLGLGLPLVKRVAQELGGDVHAESQPNKGSRISILLPMIEADHRRRGPGPVTSNHARRGRRPRD